MTDSLWKSITAKHKTGKDTWLGWKPFRDENEIIISEVVPKLGMWDIGCQKWVSHFEDHSDPDGHRPMPFHPQPDYACDGYIPPAPTI